MKAPAFIFRSVIVTLLLLLAYNGLLLVWHPAKTTNQNIWQDNIFAMQEYLYDQPAPQVLLLGSSITDRLKMDAYPAFYNMAAGDGNPFTGLAILERSGKLPKLLLIEVNTLLGRTVDARYLDYLFTPGLYQIRQHMPSARLKYQPVSLFNPQTLRENRAKPAKKPGEQANAVQPPAVSAGKGLQEAILKVNQKKYDRALDSAQLQQSLEQLRYYLSYLQKQGVRVAFFEVPMHCTMHEAQLMVSRKTQLQQHFPPGEYTYLPSDACADYIAPDGIHLNKPSAQQFAQFLVRQTQRAYPELFAEAPALQP